jgi:hypothetical protein
MAVSYYTSIKPMRIYERVKSLLTLLNPFKKKTENDMVILHKKSLDILLNFLNFYLHENDLLEYLKPEKQVISENGSLEDDEIKVESFEENLISIYFNTSLLKVFFNILLNGEYYNKSFIELNGKRVKKLLLLLREKRNA